MIASIITAHRCREVLVFLAGLLMLLTQSFVQAQSPTETQSLEDQGIEARISSIYGLLEPLSAVEVEVQNGVVLLSGSVSNERQAERALALAAQIPGVITVDDGIQRQLDVQGNLTPLLEQVQGKLIQWFRALPLIGLVALIFAIVVYLGYALAGWDSLWRRLSPNPFLAELLAQTIRTAAVLLALVVALNLLGATALMATILGGAGVVGLAIGFAVRDTIENYIASIMLSLRQPFRANDHVIINEHEGKVVRLTSRATVLMTLDGNQLRIPNATVFKAVILNYTRNPQRRFRFELGVDASDDPVAAIQVGVEAVAKLPFVLKDPAPVSIIKTVGDSSIILDFSGWIDQQQTDFGKARSLAIRATMKVLEQQGFTLPEPIYRLRFDQELNLSDVQPEEAAVTSAVESQPRRVSNAEITADEVLDVKPDNHLEEMVNDERALKGESDLLDSTRPVE